MTCVAVLRNYSISLLGAGEQADWPGGMGGETTLDDGRMVKLLQPVLTVEMMTKAAIALLALPLAMGGLILPTGGGY
jgi:hypothetical protein